MWMGANLQYDGLKSILDKLIPKKERVKSPTEINDDWKKLASFMSGRT